MLSSLRRFKPHPSMLPAAWLAAGICALGLLIIWARPTDQTEDINRYGNALAASLSHVSAGYLLQQDRLNLAIIAGPVVALPEVEGIIFYGPADTIVTASGETDAAASASFSSVASLDEQVTGRVTVVLREAAFASQGRHWLWLASLGVLIASPYLAMFVIQLSRRGNRSLPVVSMPDPEDTQPQAALLIIANLHNQISLSRTAQTQTLADAAEMAQEVCALYPGLTVPLAEQGIALVLAADSATTTQAVYAGFLLQTLLREFETEGAYRCCLTQITVSGSAAERQTMTADELAEVAHTDELLTVAALAKQETLLMESALLEGFDHDEQAEPFNHPILDDLANEQRFVLIDRLPDSKADLVAEQAEMILGFAHQAS